MLSRLALRSKAHWGYDAAFLDACRDELTVAVAAIERGWVAVLEAGGGIEGFYLLRPEEDADPAAGSDPVNDAELEFLYVEPSAVGRGHGRRLWRHMVVSARSRGYNHISIHSDPHAEGFYRAMGARTVDEIASGSIEGRVLPLMHFDLREGDRWKAP